MVVKKPQDEVGYRSMNKYAFMGITVASLGGLLYGIEIGFGSPAMQMDTFRKAIGWPPAPTGCGLDSPGDPVEVSAQLGMLQATFTYMTISSLFAGFFADSIGRKWVMYIGCLFYIVGAVIETFSGISGGSMMGAMVAGRVLTGAANGWITMIVSEICAHSLFLVISPFFLFLTFSFFFLFLRSSFSFFFLYPFLLSLLSLHSLSCPSPSLTLFLVSLSFPFFLSLTIPYLSSTGTSVRCRIGASLFPGSHRRSVPASDHDRNLGWYCCQSWSSECGLGMATCLRYTRCCRSDSWSVNVGDA